MIAPTGKRVHTGHHVAQKACFSNAFPYISTLLWHQNGFLLGIKSIGCEVQGDVYVALACTPNRCFTKEFQAFARFRPPLPGGGKYRMIGFPKGFQRFRAPPEFMLTLHFPQNVVLPMLFDAFHVSVSDFRGGKI